MITRWLDLDAAYDGSQLRPHWILKQTGAAGDAAVAWRGGCAIPTAEMADLEDALAGATIAGDDMVHVVWEWFGTPDMVLATTRQRLLAALAGELLQGRFPRPVRRRGDDLYVGAGKLSISVAAVTGVSALVHFAVNATPGGAPVATATLADAGVAPEAFGVGLLDALAQEIRGIDTARAKVRFRGES